MRRIFWSLVVVLALCAVAFFRIVPAVIESNMNRIDGKPLLTVSPEAEALHRSLNIVDLHSDTLMWDRDLAAPSNRGHEDLPRLIAGNVTLQVFASTTKSPKGQNYDSNPSDSDILPALLIAQGQPRRTWTSLLERSLFHAQKLDIAVSQSQGRLRKVSDQGGLDQLLALRARWSSV